MSSTNIPTIDIESKEFYELMQAYRHSPIKDNNQTVAAYKAVKDYLRPATDNHDKMKEKLSETLVLLDGLTEKKETNY